MVKFRILFFLLTVLVVGTAGYFLSYYAKGYRFDINTLKFLPNGILVIKSNPDGAQIFIDGELKTATNATINLPPATYDVTVQKEGFSTWSKKLTIQKEVVTEADAHLYRTVPSLSAGTFLGVSNPLPSPDFTKIVYIVPENESSPAEQPGLWIMETVNLPLGFSREPRRITDGDLSEAQITWSPDGRELLLQTTAGTFLLDASSFTSAAERIDISPTIGQTLSQWILEEDQRRQAKIAPLPDKLEEILMNNVSSIVFSPDESKILYTASSSATLPSEIIKPIPGASTQAEERDLKPGSMYVYDIKEDRNFLIERESKDIAIEIWKNTDRGHRMFWFATSRHLVLAQENKITIMDLDGTNRQVVYSGNYVSPNALPAPSIDRLSILTNLGALETIPNIYTLSLK